MIYVKWRKICTDAVIPQFARSGDAGADITTAYDYTIPPHGKVIVKSGLQVEVPQGYELQIRPRSGMALKTPLIIPNSPGTIDSGYRGEVCVIFWNTSELQYKIKKGERIAQCVVSKIPETQHIEVVEELTDSERGVGGFGSTGI